MILGPQFPHVGKDVTSAARLEATALLDSRGSSPRSYKNTLVFLAADATRLREMQQAIRQFLAWTSIWDERETLNLDPFQTKQAETKRRGADETVKARVPETYHWLIVPGQSDPRGEAEWTEIRLQGQDSLAARAAKKLKNEELLLVQLGGTRLRHELDRVPLWRGNHVGIKQLSEDVAKYLYLPRLRDEDVLLGAIREGLERLTWQSETFAYAEGWDETRNRYQGLKAGQPVRVLSNAQTLLVKPEVAADQFEADHAQQNQVTQQATGVGSGNLGTETGRPGQTTPAGNAGGSIGTTPPVEPTKPRRFYGSVKIDSLRLGRDASRIAEEVVQHLAGLVGGNVEITLEIQADIPDGVPPELVRTITENCRTLRFENQGFERT